LAGQERESLSFSGLLRLLRGEAKLTQEELAEAAGLSQRAVSDLERGIHPTARKDTALLLARGAEPNRTGGGGVRGGRPRAHPGR
jgi:transcriptional regulator with XRE-family HTH domain